MSCAVAISGSTGISPCRISLLCNRRDVSSSETLAAAGSPSSRSPSSSAPSLPSASSSFSLRRLQKQAGGWRSCCKVDACVEDLVDPSPTTVPAAAPSSSSTVLKRKRPARIDIPMSSLNFAAPEVIQEGPMEVEVENSRFALFCKKGRRGAMEDQHAAALNLYGDPKQAFFGVFDGHGGVAAAKFASESLCDNIMDEVIQRGGEENGIAAAVRRGYLNTDSKFLNQNSRGGTCCATALIKDGSVIVSNAGDCRAVMSRGGVAEALTDDHRPSREDEKGRIELLGGYVDYCHGVWRLQGSLAVSRAIGDAHLKKWVIAEPETTIIRLKSDCEFLILASDGLWDKVGNQEAVDMVRALCANSDDNPPLLSACKKLVGLSASRGSTDDITVMVIHLGRFV